MKQSSCTCQLELLAIRLLVYQEIISLMEERVQLVHLIQCKFLYRGLLLTANNAYLNQAFLAIHAGGRAGEFPVGKTNRSQTATEVVIK